MDSYYNEIKNFVTDKVDAGVIVRADWMAKEYIDSKGAMEADDPAFYRFCAVAQVNEMVRKAIGKYDTKPNTEDKLPGFEHLQRAYTVMRDGVKLLVPVHDCADDELLARASEYDAMAKTCRAHARELRKYIKDRANFGLARSAQ